MANVLRIHTQDNVAVALQDLAQGEPLELAAEEGSQSEPTRFLQATAATDTILRES